jgi:hypothetical protein
LHADALNEALSLADAYFSAYRQGVATDPVGSLTRINSALDRARAGARADATLQYTTLDAAQLMPCRAMNAATIVPSAALINVKFGSKGRSTCSGAKPKVHLRPLLMLYSACAADT